MKGGGAATRCLLKVRGSIVLVCTSVESAQSQRTGQTKLTSHWTMYDKYRDSMAARFEEPISLQATLCQEKAMFEAVNETEQSRSAFRQLLEWGRDHLLKFIFGVADPDPRS